MLRLNLSCALECQKPQKTKFPRSFSAREFGLEGAVAHAARGGDGRQEGRECSYYHLHRNLNNLLLHDY